MPKEFLPGLAQDASDLALNFYNTQHQLREQYPVADAVIGLVPFVGTATAADDVATSLAAGKYGEAAINALGFIPGEKVVKGVIKGAEWANKAAHAAAIQQGLFSARHNIGDAAQLGVLAGGTVSGAAYAADVLRRQQEANKK